MSRNIDRSITFYDLLGFKLFFSDSEREPKYVGVTRDGIELHIQWHDEKEWDFPNDRPTYRFVVNNVDDLFAEFTEKGIKDFTKPQNTPWGTYEFHVRDPDMNGLQFYQSN